MNYLYAPESVVDAERYSHEIVNVLGRNAHLELYRKFPELLARLKRANNTEFMILLVDDRKDLADIVAHRDAYLNAAILLLVPDEEPSTIASAHLLRPRFLGRLEDGKDNAVSVLRRMVKRRNGSATA
jgi:hypothetical protein